MDRDSVLSEAQPGWVYRQFFVAVTKRDEQSLGLDDLSIFHLSKRYCIESYPEWRKAWSNPRVHSAAVNYDPNRGLKYLSERHINTFNQERVLFLDFIASSLKEEHRSAKPAVDALLPLTGAFCAFVDEELSVEEVADQIVRHMPAYGEDI